MYTLQQPRLKVYPTFVVFKDEFTKEECLKIIERAKQIDEHNAFTGGQQNPQANLEIRSSKLHWMNWSQEDDWVFARLANLINKVKINWYPFSLSHMPEPLQITHYLASEGGHYSMHKDMGDDDMSTRKLSIVMLLNDEKEFEGGALEMIATPGDDKKVYEAQQGTVIVFPSWELHRVLKLTKGDRWSLVTWIHGPPFT